MKPPSGSSKICVTFAENNSRNQPPPQPPVVTRKRSFYEFDNSAKNLEKQIPAARDNLLQSQRLLVSHTKVLRNLRDRVKYLEDTLLATTVEYINPNPILDPDAAAAPAAAPISDSEYYALPPGCDDNSGICWIQKVD